MLQFRHLDRGYGAGRGRGCRHGFCVAPGARFDGVAGFDVRKLLLPLRPTRCRPRDRLAVPLRMLSYVLVCFRSAVWIRGLRRKRSWAERSRRFKPGLQGRSCWHAKAARELRRCRAVQPYPTPHVVLAALAATRTYRGFSSAPSHPPAEPSRSGPAGRGEWAVVIAAYGVLRLACESECELIVRASLWSPSENKSRQFSGSTKENDRYVRDAAVGSSLW